MEFKKLSLLNTRMFSYRFFKKFPQWQHLNTGKMSDVTRVIRTFHDEFIKAVCSGRYGVDLPAKLGKIFIVAFKAPHYPDFSLFRKIGHVSKFLNLHTDGLKCHISYSNHERRFRVKDRVIWEFSPERGFMQNASKAFAANHTQFETTVDKRKPFYAGLDFDLKEASENRIEKFLVTYDEFQLT
jgi:hypothetical protein